MDESCFQLSPQGEIVLAPRNRPTYAESKHSDKENITTLFSVNAVGEVAPPLTLYKYERLPIVAFKSAPPGWGVGKTDSGWMTSESFFEYIANVFLPWIVEQKIELPIIVFLDGHRSHTSLSLSKFCAENGLILVALFPNSTHITQPLDVAVFAPIKRRWKRVKRDWHKKERGYEICKFDVPEALADVIAGLDMKTNTISGFKRTGVYPFDENNVDYTRIIRRIPDPVTAESEEIDNVDLSFLDQMEMLLNPSMLNKFKSAFCNGGDWDGEIESKDLFLFWKKVCASTLPTENNHDLASIDDFIQISSPSPKFTSNSIEEEKDSKPVEVTIEDSIKICPPPPGSNFIKEERNYVEVTIEDFNQFSSPSTEFTSNFIEEEKDSEPVEVSAEDFIKICPHPPESFSNFNKEERDSMEVTIEDFIQISSPSPRFSSNFIEEYRDDNGNFVEVEEVYAPPPEFQDDFIENDLTQGGITVSTWTPSVKASNPKKRSLAEILNGVVRCPEQLQSKKKRGGKEHTSSTHSVLTSDKWIEIEQAKEDKKMKMDEEKRDRKVQRELKKKTLAEEKEKKKKISAKPRKKNMKKTICENTEQKI
ncbi:uncharacterized protein DMENIID0001_006470 [Sergentomyia squamirostris]